MIDIYATLFFILLISYPVFLHVYSILYTRDNKRMKKLIKYLNKKQHNDVEYNIKIGYPTCKVYDKHITCNNSNVKTIVNSCDVFNIKDVNNSTCYTHNLKINDDDDVHFNHHNQKDIHYIIDETTKVIVYKDKKLNKNIITKYSEEKINEIIKHHTNMDIEFVSVLISILYMCFTPFLFILSDLGDVISKIIISPIIFASIACITYIIIIIKKH